MAHQGAGGLFRPKPSLRPVFHNDCWVLLLLEPLTHELQCPRILGDGPDDLLRRAIWHMCLNLQRYLHVCIDKTREMRDDLLADPSGIPADAGRVEPDRPMEPRPVPKLGPAGIDERTAPLEIRLRL